MNSGYGSNSSLSNTGGDSSTGNSSWSPVAPSSVPIKIKNEPLAQPISSSNPFSSFSNSNHDTMPQKVSSFDSLQQRSSNNESDSCHDYNNGDIDQNFDRQSSAASSASSGASIPIYNPSTYSYWLDDLSVD